MIAGEKKDHFLLSSLSLSYDIYAGMLNSTGITWAEISLYYSQTQLGSSLKEKKEVIFNLF